MASSDELLAPDLRMADDTVLGILRSCNELYGYQQLAATSMRKGFLNLAKARQSLGRGTVSALDCREDMWASATVEEAA